jgi:hypothetical protein
MPDPSRAEQIRTRCRGLLAQQARRACASPDDAPLTRPMHAWQPLIAILVVAYLAEVIVQALRMYNLR